MMAEHASYSWSCLNCGLPNFSTAIYGDFSISDCSTNNFSVLARGGGTLKFSVYIGEADFLGVKILNSHIFGGFQKN